MRKNELADKLMVDQITKAELNVAKQA